MLENFHKAATELCFVAAILATFSSVDVSNATADEPTSEGAAARSQTECGQIDDPNERTSLSAVFSPDGNLLAVGLLNGAIEVWDARTGVDRRKFSGHLNAVASMAFSPDSKRLVSGSWDGTGNAICWNVETGAKLFTLPDHSGEIMSAVFSADGRRIATGSDLGQMILWDAQTGQKLASFVHRKEGDLWPGYVRDIAFSPDGKVIATASEDKSVIVWDIQTKTQLRSIGGFDGQVTCVSFSPDGKLLAASDYLEARLWKDLPATSNRTAEHQSTVWNATTGERVGVVPGSRPIAWTAENKLLVDMLARKILVDWDPNSAKENRQIDYSKAGGSDKDEPFVWGCTPDRKRLAIFFNERRSVVLWDTEAQTVVRQLATDSTKAAEQPPR